MKIVALLLFILMYALMIAYSKKRHYIALITAFVFVLLGILPYNQVLTNIDLNVLLMLSGTMILVYYFIESKMPALIADFLLDRAPNVMWVTIFMSAFAGIISAFIDNTATVLMIAPVGIAICKKLRKNPVPMILALAISSNLQGAATLVGDTTSIMLGAYAKLDFMDFFFLNGKPGMFFSVELGAIASIFVLLYVFRREKKEVEASKDVRVTNYFPTILLISLVVSLIVASFVQNKSEIANGLICMTFALISFFFDLDNNKRENKIVKNVREIDYQTLLLLTGIFLVIGGIKHVGLIDDIANIITNIGGDNVFILYTIIVFGSSILSAFIDNIPYVATMLPVISAITLKLGISPYLFYFGLLCGATLGGNLTPIGASANITAVGLLRKEGYHVSFMDFFKIGFPLTLSALLTGYLFIWLVWC